MASLKRLKERRDDYLTLNLSLVGGSMALSNSMKSLAPGQNTLLTNNKGKLSINGTKQQKTKHRLQYSKSWHMLRGPEKFEKQNNLFLKMSRRHSMFNVAEIKYEYFVKFKTS